MVKGDYVEHISGVKGVVKKINGNIATFERRDLEKIYTSRGNYVYQSFICWEKSLTKIKQKPC